MTDITPLPAPPSTSDPVNFATRADAFLGALPDFADEMNAYGGKLNSFSTNSTSSTSLAVGTGSKSLTVTTSKSYVTGMYIRVVSTSTPTNYMQGTVTSYNSGTGALVFTSEIVGGSGTIASWTISMSANPANQIIQGNTSVEVTDTGSNGKVVINTEGTDRVTVDSSGNVGIGTSSPGGDSTNKVLEISATDSARLNLTPGGTSSYLRAFPSTLQVGTDSNIPIQVFTNGTERMRITSDGDVGIGLTSPSTKLDVDGQISGKFTDVGTNTAAQALATNHVSQVTISSDATLTTTVPPAGSQAIVIIVSSGASSRTVTFGTGFASTGTLATGATTDRRFVVSFVSDGTRLLECSRTAAITV